MFELYVNAIATILYLLTNHYSVNGSPQPRI